MSGVSADSVDLLALLEVNLCSCDALCYEAVLGNAGLLAVDDCLGNSEGSLKVAEVIRTIECPKGAGAHAVILHLVSNLIVVSGNCHGNSPRGTFSVHCTSGSGHEIL